MQNSLRTFLAHRTVARLRESIQVKGPLPGLATAVRLMEMAEERQGGKDSDIIKAVLADPSLMQKVLRLANSSMYATFGGDVDSISRALAILGTETVAHLAFSQTLLDNFKPSSGTNGTVARMESATLAGHMARQFSKGAKGKDVETAVICALMHSMGKLLLEFYLPNDGLQLSARMEETSMSETEVATQLLGLSLEALGLEAAREWRMPPSILAGLRHMPPSEDSEMAKGADRLAAISTLAHQCAETMEQGPTVASQARLAALTANYSVMLGTTPELLLNDLTEAKAQAGAERAVAVAQQDLVEPAVTSAARVSVAACIEQDAGDIRARVGSIAPGEALSIATESLFTGLGLSRAFVFIRKGSGYSARMGVGVGAKALIPELQFDDTGAHDILSGAMRLDQVAYLSDTSKTAAGSPMPLWWSKPLGNAKGAIFVPILVNQKPLGFIYGDWEEASHSHALLPAELAPIEKLRKAVLAAVLKPVVQPPVTRQVAPRPQVHAPSVVRAGVSVLDSGRMQAEPRQAVR